MLMVNLLPWRKNRLRRRARHWWGGLALLGGVLAASLGAGGLNVFQQRVALERQWAAASLRQRQQAHLLRQTLDARTQLRRIQARRRANEAARDHNRRYLALLEALSALIPADVWLTKIADRGTALELMGISRRYADIVLFSQRLHGQDIFAAVRMIHAQKNERPPAAVPDEAALAFLLLADWRSPVNEVAGADDE